MVKENHISAGTPDDDCWPPLSGLPHKSRMVPQRKLEWGQTPFDNLSRAELLRLVQAYHSALASHVWPMQLMRRGNEQSLFWKRRGLGFKAVSKANALMKLCGWDRDGGERMSRSFFRYADDLMFPHLSAEKWTVYPDGSMTRPGYEPGGRSLKWVDLVPEGQGGDRR